MIVRNVAGQAGFRPARMGKSALAAGEKLFAGLNAFEAGQRHRLHAHPGQDKLYYVVEGEGLVTVGSQSERIKAGDLALALAGEPHSLENPGPGRLLVLVVMAPPPGRD